MMSKKRAGRAAEGKEAEDAESDQEKEAYSPDRLDLLAQSLRDTAGQIAGHASAMRADSIPEVKLGDAMVRRSYRYITQFVRAIERAIDKVHEDKSGTPRAPW